MAKRKITAREILNDFKADMSDPDLMRKYELSAEGLQSVFSKMLKAGLITHADLESRVTVTDKTVDLGFVCPSCGYLRTEEFDQCPRCGFATPTYIVREREKERKKKEPPAPGKRVGPSEALKRDTPTVTISAPREPVQPEAPVMETAVEPAKADMLAGLGSVINQCRILGLAALVAYFIALAGIFYFVVYLSPAAVEGMAQMFITILVLQIPALVIVLTTFITLRALTESLKVFSEVSGHMLRQRPRG
jgi:hypothetical protein